MRGLLIVILLAVAFSSCKKDEDVPAPAKLRLSLSHGVHDAPLIFDSLLYRNGAGELYSISRLNYFLSSITFYQGNAAVYSIDTVAYIDAKNPYTFIIPELSSFSYDSVSYYIGVPAARNMHGMLEATFDNVAMEWPDGMGGGYHFLKLEGHWSDSGSVVGYTVHLGTDPYLVHGGFKASGHVNAGATNTIALHMDVGEWLEHPHNFSFETDGVYTMGNAALMQKIMEDGKDVIGLKQ